MLVSAVRHMEDLEQGDGWRVNRKKSGAVVSHACLKELAVEAAKVRGTSPSAWCWVSASRSLKDGRCFGGTC